MYNNKFDAITELYPSVKHIEIKSYGTIIAKDENYDEVSIDVSKVNEKETELDNSKSDLKSSAKAKLIAGEPLTEAEADTLIL